MMAATGLRTGGSFGGAFGSGFGADGFGGFARWGPDFLDPRASSSSTMSSKALAHANDSLALANGDASRRLFGDDDDGDDDDDGSDDSKEDRSRLSYLLFPASVASL